MRHVEICGKRGLGDLISGTSNALIKISSRNERTHIRFNYRPGYDYIATIKVLMDEFIYNRELISYEVSEEWFTVHASEALKKFKNIEKNKDWFFTACYSHVYMPFKTQWKRDKEGPIALVLNNERKETNYPYPEKWIPDDLNKKLLNLIDEKNFVLLGKPYTIEESIEKLSRCRYAIGIDTAWVHASNAMNVPYFLLRNNWKLETIEKLHSKHPCLKIIETEDIYKYIFGAPTQNRTAN